MALYGLTNSEDPDEMGISSGSALSTKTGQIHDNLEFSTCDPLKYKLDYPISIALICLVKSIIMKIVSP